MLCEQVTVNRLRMRSRAPCGMWNGAAWPRGPCVGRARGIDDRGSVGWGVRGARNAGYSVFTAYTLLLFLFYYRNV